MKSMSCRSPVSSATNFRKSAIAAAVIAACATHSAAWSQSGSNNISGTTTADIPAISSGVDLSYTGSLTQVGIGINRDLKVRAQASQTLSEDALSALIAQGWFSDGNGGIRLDYNWANELENRANTESPVRKMFVAIDRNREADRKLTIGFGLENQNWFGNVSYSRGLSNRRWIGPALSSDQVTQSTGSEAGRIYVDTLTTTTVTKFFERAYDHGVGIRAGHLYSDALMRLTLGIDREWGDFSARQNTLSLGLEKFIAGSPHSFGLFLEQFNKTGEFESGGNHTRAQFVYRYSFGGSPWASSAGWRETSERQVHVPTPLDQVANVKTTEPQVVQTRKETRIVKTTASMTSDAFFDFNKADLTPAAKGELDRVAETLLASERTGNIKITGHTCDLGPDAYNLKLSIRRANSVRDYLANRSKLSPDIFVTEGMGKRQPKFPNTPVARNKNRRVDLEFIKYQDKAEEIQVPVAQPAPSATSPNIVQWQTETIDREPAWVRRALRNTVPHKQTVDTYRGADISRSTSSARAYLNRLPVAQDDAVTLSAGVATQINILANDSDPDGNALRIVSVGTPAHGTAAISGSSIIYTPATGYFGVDTFNYTIDDGAGGQASAKVTATVLRGNQAPIARDDSVTLTSGVATPISVLANDSDPDNDPLRIASVGSPAHGTAAISGINILYTPAVGFVGVDSFSYTIDDGAGGRATAKVTTTVQRSNLPPSAQNDRFVVGYAGNWPLDVLANDSDPDGDTISIVSFTQPYTGVVSMESGRLMFLSTGSFASATFTYTVSDGHGGTSTATVTLIDP